MRKEQEEQEEEQEEKVMARKEQEMETVHALASEEVCPSCGEEIAVSAPSDVGCVELECRCGCALAVA